MNNAPQPMDSSLMTPVERLRALAVAAYPDQRGPRDLKLGDSLRDAWRDLAASVMSTEWAFAARVGEKLGVEVAKLDDADPGVTRMVPEALARAHLVLPIREDEHRRLVVACASPFDVASLRRVEFAANRRLDLRIAPPDEIETSISFVYSRAAEVQGSALGKLLFPAGPADEARAQFDESAIVQLARGLMLEAIDAGASDLHVQPFAGGGMARIRVDGILRRLAFLPGQVLPALVRYLKANSGMDPTTDRVPQDGRISIVRGKQDYDLRISVLPASRGERLVIRFLDQSRVYRLSGIGMANAEVQALRRMMANTAGVVLMTGPTGSGKTSTLYSMLSEINTVGVSIITVENPVEYRVTGVSQVEVNPKAGLTFSSALRSILRQDPDVILIGEIRDRETAEIAMQAALTGHLVFSTLHTNDALTAIPRLIDLGVEPSALADGLIGVIAQRLLRRLCTACRTPVALPLLPDEELFHDLTGERPAYRAVGCEACGQSGFAGRMPVLEVVEMNPELAQRISHGSRSVSELRAAVGGTLASMTSTAARRVVSGDTTAREAARVIGQRFWRDLAGEFRRPLPRHVNLSVGGEDKASPDPVAVVFARDHEYARRIGAALEAEHFRAVIATQVEEGRKLAQAEENAVVLIADLDPGAGGDAMALLVQLRVAFAWSRIPAIPIVRAGDAEVRAVMEQHGVSDYLVKPADPAEIAARARALIKG